MASPRLVAVASIAVGIVASTGPAVPAGGFSGDGSFSDNPALSPNSSLRLSTAAVAAYPDASVGSGYSGYVVQSSSPIDLYAPESAPINPVPAPIAVEAQPQPILADPSQLVDVWSTPEPDRPFETDWSVGLRGSYVSGTSGTQTNGTILPNFSLSRSDADSQTSLSAAGSVSVSDQLVTFVDSSSLTLSHQTALGRTLGAEIGGALSLSKANPAAPGADETVLDTPLVLDASLTGGLTWQTGKFALTGSGVVARHAVGDGLLIGDVVQYNGSQTYWQYGGSLRAGFELTPIISPYIQGSAYRNQFDAAPVSTAIALHNVQYAGEVGAALSWSSGFGLEAGIGYQLTDYDDTSLTNLGSMTYRLGADMTPTEGLSLAAEVSTTHNPGDPDNAVPSSADYSASLSASMALSDQFTLRGAASGTFVVPNSATLPSFSNNFGVGVDYAWNGSTNLSVDYAYARADNQVDPAEDSHSVLLGVTFSRPE